MFEGLEKVDVIGKGCGFTFDGNWGGCGMFMICELEVGNLRIETEAQEEDLN